LSTFASLSFAGDKLNPAGISKLLGVEPTTAYRKGEVYKRSRGHEVVGRTGLWLLSSRGHVKSGELNDHLAYLKAVIFPNTGNDLVTPIRALMRDEGLEADVSCFWYGEHGATAPLIPEEISAAFACLGATIETDFDTD
jgi:hypothetical protein